MAEAKIIDRIRKLLRLALSDNAGEAANALAHAQRLMARHRIERSQLDEPDPEEIELFMDEPLEHVAIIPPWKQALGGAIAEVNDCLCLVSERRVDGKRVMAIAGRREDFDAVSLMYRWIVGEIERLCREAAHRRGFDARVVGRGRRWMHSFRTGAATEVEDRIYREQADQRAALAADPTTMHALDVRRGAVHEWAEENIEQHDPSPRLPELDREAFELGALAGRTISLRGRDGEPAE